MDADKLLRKLIRSISIRGTVQRGEITRVASELEVSPSTVHRWIFLNVEPRKAMREKIKALLDDSQRVEA